MHNDFSLLATITMAVLFAFLCGFAARKLRLPSLVGYLIAGLLISPFTPGFVGDVSAAGQLAEVGVIFMMFGVGLHFSLRDLWNVRQIAIPGAILQTTLSTLIGLALGQLWGWSFEAGLVLGLSISVASTVVLLRGLTDHGLVSTPHGRVAIGWLVFEDLATIVILVLMPVLVGGSGNPLVSVGVALLKTAVFVIIMLVIGTRVLSWLLTQIAYTRSRELFILAVVAMAVGTSFAAFELFGVSLALGAFLAGVVIGESDVHHQVNAEAVPFRDFFSVLFFVSVGMLVDPAVVMANIGKVVVLSLLVIGGKAVITLLLGFVLPSSARTMIVVAAGLSQIGEFSFIVGQAGVGLGLIDGDQYGLILAAAVVSIVVNPLMFALIPGMERALRGVPWLWRLMDRGGPTPVAFTEEMEGHVVIIGYGRVGSHIDLEACTRLGIAVATGGQTQLGRIAASLSSADSARPPLLVRMDRFSGRIALVVSVAVVVLGGVAVLRGSSLGSVFLLAVALAVSAIPEGLPVALTVALSIGARRMGQRKVIARRLVAVESLGSCTFIASDKTGTLTLNELTARRIAAEAFKSAADSALGPVMRAVRTALATASGETSSARALSLAMALQAAFTGKAFAGWDGPPAGFIYFVLRSDAIDVLYGTPEGFERLGVPYMAHIQPPAGWGA